MSKRSQEKRKARSKEKKLARRRLQGMSPLSRLAGTAQETCECWMSCSEDERMLSLQVMRPVRGGQTVGAFFLIDRDCIGLKDAFYRLDIDPAQLRETLRARSEMEGVRIVRMDLAEARKLVAGALRWTRANPFRMPADAERCVKILDGVGDIENADISDFGDEDGNLFYVGRQIDLEPRLQGLTLAEFMGREDVKCVFHFGDETFGDTIFDDDGDVDEDEPLMEREDEDLDDEDAAVTEEDLLVVRERLKRQMLDAVRRWCFSKAIMPHPELEAAVDLSVAAIIEGLAEEDEEACTQRAIRAKNLLRSFESPEKQAALAEAQAQLTEYAKSFPTPEAYFTSLNMNPTNA